MYSLEKRPQSLFSVASVVLCVDLIPTGGFLNSDILFCGSVRVAVVVHCSTISVTNLVYWPLHIVSVTSDYWLCSRNGFPISYSIVTSVLTSYTNAACTPYCWYLWRRVSNAISTILLICSLFLNFKLILPISCRATIQHLYAHCLPEPFTFALFCSWYWPSIMTENLLLVTYVHHKFCRYEFWWNLCLFCSECRYVSDVYGKPSGAVHMNIFFCEVDICNAVHRFIFRYLHPWNTSFILDLYLHIWPILANWEWSFYIYTGMFRK